MKHPYMARGSLPGMDQLVNKGADTVTNDDYVGPSESTKRLMLQHTANEQLIELAKILVNAKHWPMDDVEKVPDILRALLEENKRLKDDLVRVESGNIRLWKENEQVKAERDYWINEHSKETERGDRLRSELSAKDKVLRDLDAHIDFSEPLNDEAVGIAFDDVSGVNEVFERAHAVLSSYPPREKGADNEQRD